MEENNVKKRIIMIIALGIVALSLGVGGVYAYFAAAVTQDTTSNVTISAVSGLAISFSNSPNLEIENALPGQSWTKTFSATLTNNTSEIGITYSVYLHIKENTFDQSKGYLTYRLTGAEEKSNIQISTTSGENIPIVENKTIKGNKESNEVVHTYTLTISYPNDEDSIQQQGGVLNGYVYFETGSNQIYDNVKFFNHEGTQPKSRDNLEIGDLVTIGTEEFYVIPYDDGTIVKDGKAHALAKYNLLVGNICDADGANCTKISEITTSYGLQNATAKGYDGENSRIGTTEFSNNNFVTLECDDSSKWLGKCNTTYTGSLAQKYVDDYIIKLKSQGGVLNLEGRLVLQQELVRLGCNCDNQNCNKAPEWVYNVSFWTGSQWTGTGGRFGVKVLSNGGCGSTEFRNQMVGIRPVIIF